MGHRLVIRKIKPKWFSLSYVQKIPTCSSTKQKMKEQCKLIKLAKSEKYANKNRQNEVTVQYKP